MLQVEAASEAARRAAQPAKSSLSIGFLTGYEMDWLPAVMGILRGRLPRTEITIHSEDSPELAAGLLRGTIDLAFLRPEKHAPGLQFKLLRHDPLLALMPRDHPLAARSAIRPQWELKCEAPSTQFTVTVEATDASGSTDTDTIVIAAAGFRPPDRTADGSDADAVGAWPERHLLGTRLGPNRNGRQW